MNSTSTHSLQAKGVIIPYYFVQLVYITLISAVVSSAKHIAEHMEGQFNVDYEACFKHWDVGFLTTQQ